MQETDNLILESLTNISQLSRSLNTLLAKNRSASCASIKQSLQLPLQPRPDTSNYMTPTASSYFNKVKKLMHSNPSLLVRKPATCTLHHHRNCEACRMLRKDTQRRKQVGCIKSPKKEVKERKRAQTTSKVIVINKVTVEDTNNQLIGFRKDLEERLKGINMQLKQVARAKIIESQQSFCLNSLKTSIRSQFTNLKDGPKGVRTSEQFSFEQQQS